MPDILFTTEEFVFSYRIAGICVQNGKVLLQKPTDSDDYAFPGGHSAFGETNEETLIRELKEEIGAEISVGELKWVGEIFFPWDGKPCHQICLYYEVSLKEKPSIPTNGIFLGDEQIEGRGFKIEFHWVPLREVGNLKVYPTNTLELLGKLDCGVQHFVYREKE